MGWSSSEWTGFLLRAARLLTVASSRTDSPGSGARAARKSTCSLSRARPGTCVRRARRRGRRRRRRCWRRRCWPTSPTPSGSPSSRRCCGRSPRWPLRGRGPSPRRAYGSSASPYFLHHRELLGELARAAWETVLELMCAAAGDKGMRPGMVAVVQTAGDLGNWHPHVHALVSRRSLDARRGRGGSTSQIGRTLRSRVPGAWLQLRSPRTKLRAWHPLPSR